MPVSRQALFPRARRALRCFSTSLASKNGIYRPTFLNSPSSSKASTDQVLTSGFGPPSSSQTSRAARCLVADIKMNRLDPVVLLKDRVSHGTLDVDSAGVCLHMYKMVRLIKLPRSERVAKAKADGLGALILSWAWNDAQRWADVLRNDILLFQALCYFLVSEGREAYVLSLLKIKEPANVNLRPAWRGILFRTLVHAKLETTLGTSADSTLGLFAKVRSEVLQYRATDTWDRTSDSTYETMSFWPALTELTSALGSGTWPGTTPSKFWAHMQNYTFASTVKEIQIDLSRNSLRVHLPDARDHHLPLAFLKDRFNDVTGPELQRRLSTAPANRGHIYFFCKRL